MAGCTFQDNNAVDTSGGAVRVAAVGYVHIIDSVFQNNSITLTKRIDDGYG